MTKSSSKSEGEINTFQDKVNIRELLPQIRSVRIVKNSYSGRSKIIQVRNSDLREKRKSIKERASENKVKHCAFLFVIGTKGNRISKQN